MAEDAPITGAAPAGAAPPRRIITGHDETGQGRVLNDGPAPASYMIGDGATFHDMWVTSTSPVAIAGSEDEPVRTGETLGPPLDGTRVRIVDMPPGTRSPMHRTESVDYGVVLAGEITLVLDDGSATTVHAGELVVQRGTDHAWENRSNAPARILFVLVAGRFAPALRERLSDPL
jgi:quercetin dioxygenase-like cupin family protein